MQNSDGSIVMASLLLPIRSRYVAVKLHYSITMKSEKNIWVSIVYSDSFPNSGFKQPRHQ